MTHDEAIPPNETTSAETELDLQEALARRHRAADLFGASDWEDEIDELEEGD